MKRKEDRSRASLRSAASERKPLKINSEKGKRNEGRRGVLRRTKSRTFWLGMGVREARSPHPHVDTVAPGEGALSGPHVCIPLHPYILSVSPPDPVLLAPHPQFTPVRMFDVCSA